MSIDLRLGELERLVRWLSSRTERALEAEFVDTAAGPASSLRVTVPGYDDGEHTFGPVVWSPLGNALPAAGDRCLVAESDDGSWWVLAWWSSGQSMVATTPETTRLVGAGGQPAFEHGWANFDAATRPAGFYKYQGRVHLEGIVSGGTVGQSAFTLPAGYLPAMAGPSQRAFAVETNPNAAGLARVSSTGLVIPNTGSNTYFFLDGISFRHA